MHSRICTSRLSIAGSVLLLLLFWLLCQTWLCSAITASGTEQAELTRSAKEEIVTTPALPTNQAAEKSQIENFATLLIQWGAMVLMAVILVTGIVTAIAGFTTSQSIKAHRESSTALEEIRKASRKCERLMAEMVDKAKKLAWRIERIYLDGALHDLAQKGTDAIPISKRFNAAAVIGELGHYSDLRFLIAALDKPYETGENKAAIKKAIHKITGREEGDNKLGYLSN